MGTKFGGEHYSKYKQKVQQNTLFEEIPSKEGNRKSFEQRFGELVNTKSNQMEPKSIVLRKLSKFGEEVKNEISNQLKIEEIHMFGSYVKGTMTNSDDRKDVDLLFILDRRFHQNWLEQDMGTINALNRLRNILLKNPRYDRGKVSVNGNAVSIEIDNIKVDIVIGFRNLSERGFLIPDTSNGGRWIKTDPRTSGRVLNIMDKKYNGQVKQLVRLAKDWNERNGKILKSYHIEATVIHYFRTIQPNSDQPLYANIDEYFFRLPEYVSSNNIRDPATEEKLSGYLDTKKRMELIRRALKTRDTIKRARKASSNSMYTDSLEYYRRVLYDNQEDKL